MSLSQRCIFDTGAEINILPKSLIPSSLVKRSRQSRQPIIGIGGSTKAHGEVDAKIYFDGDTRPFPITFAILDDYEDIIIGQPIWDNPEVIRYTMDNDSDKLCLERRNPGQGDPVTYVHCPRRTTRVHAVARESQTACPNVDTLPEESKSCPHFDLSSSDKKTKNNEPKTDVDVTSKVDHVEWLRVNKGLNIAVPIPDALKKSGCISDFTEHQIAATAALCYEYRDLFQTEDEVLGSFIKEVRIPTTGHPSKSPRNHVPEALEERFDRQMEKLVKGGLIEHCENPRGFMSPLFAVEKKDKNDVRVVINFKNTLNTVLVEKDQFPLPKMDDIFAKIGSGNKFFACCDLRKGYWQCTIHPDDRHVTAFTWKGRTWQCTRLPMGMATSGNIFTRCVSEALDSVAKTELLPTNLSTFPESSTSPDPHLANVVSPNPGSSNTESSLSNHDLSSSSLNEDKTTSAPNVDNPTSTRKRPRKFEDLFKNYSDDNLVHAKTFPEFLLALRHFFKAMMDFGLQLNPAKCVILTRKAAFLGRIVSSKGYEPNPEYIEGLLKWKEPTTKKELESLIGHLLWVKDHFGCRKGEMVRNCNFSALLKHLTELRKLPKKDFRWTAEAHSGWKVLKERLSSPPIIRFPDFSKKFVLITDASNVAMGGVLMQLDECGQPVIVAAGSKTLSKTEQNYCATEREALAIRYFVEKYEYFLKSRDFIICTDHKALTYIDRTSFGNPKIKRWQDYLSEFSFVVEYIEGEKNVLADMLSRPNGVKEHVRVDDPTPAGRFLRLSNCGQQILCYIPSWFSSSPNEDEKIQAIPTQLCDGKKKIVNVLTTGDREPNIYDDIVNQNYEITVEQGEDDFLKSIMSSLRRLRRKPRNVDKLVDSIRSDDHRSEHFRAISHRLFLMEDTGTLCVRRCLGVDKSQCFQLTRSMRPHLLSKVNEANRHLDKCVCGNQERQFWSDANSKNYQLIIPDAQIREFLYAAHDKLVHSGIPRVEDILDDYYWFGKKQDIHDYVRSCDTCAAVKGNQGRTPTLAAGNLKKGRYPFEVLYVDFVKLRKVRGGFQYVLTILDSFSRFFAAIPTKQCRASDAAYGLRQFCLRHMAAPRIISSDRGVHFSGSAFKQACADLGIESRLHCAWRPQSTGNLERQHRTLKDAMAMLCHEKQLEWIHVIDEVCAIMNSLKNKATQHSPFFLIYGREPNLLEKSSLTARNGDKTNGNENPQKLISNYKTDMQSRLSEAHKCVRMLNDNADRLHKKKGHEESDGNLLPGDKVRIHRPQSAKAKSQYADTNWIGPFWIEEVTDRTAYVRDEDGKKDWVHRNDICLIKKRPAHLDLFESDEEDEDENLRPPFNSSASSPSALCPTSPNVDTPTNSPNEDNTSTGVDSTVAPPPVDSTASSSSEQSFHSANSGEENPSTSPKTQSTGLPSGGRSDKDGKSSISSQQTPSRRQPQRAAKRKHLFKECRPKRKNSHRPISDSSTSGGESSADSDQDFSFDRGSVQRRPVRERRKIARFGISSTKGQSYANVVHNYSPTQTQMFVRGRPYRSGEGHCSRRHSMVDRR